MKVARMEGRGKMDGFGGLEGSKRPVVMSGPVEELERGSLKTTNFTLIKESSLFLPFTTFLLL